MCFIKTCSCKFSGIPTSSSHASSFNDLTSVWNLVYAVGIGLVIASLIFMKIIGDISAKRSEVKSLKEEAWDDEVGIPENLQEQIFIKHIKGPLFFGTTSDFQALAKQIPNR